MRGAPPTPRQRRAALPSPLPDASRPAPQAAITDVRRCARLGYPCARAPSYAVEPNLFGEFQAFAHTDNGCSILDHAPEGVLLSNRHADRYQMTPSLSGHRPLLVRRSFSRPAPEQLNWT